MTEIKERVIKCIECITGEKVTTPLEYLTKDLGADSLDAAELIIMLEMEFEINVPVDYLTKNKLKSITVGKLISLVEKIINI